MIGAMIHALPPDVRELVRSGIAIAGVSQCVEELVLNALDAGAACVAIRIDLDILKVQVIDNGSGIAYLDLAKVGERYMTSKCNCLDDLKSLVFHGYRGEALASIADISASVEIQTRKDATYRKVIDSSDSRIESSENRRASVGTTVTVNGLFDRLPVRRKAMKASLEKEDIISLLRSFSLVYHQVTFSLRDDATGTILFQSKRHSTLVKAFQNLYESQVGSELYEVSVEKDNVRVDSLISQSAHCDKNLQFVYVNRRKLQKSCIHDSLNELLRASSKFRKLSKEKAPTSRVRVVYPVFVVLIKLPYLDYDISFDSAKTFVEFHDWALINTCLKETVDRYLVVDDGYDFDENLEKEITEKGTPRIVFQEIRLDDIHESLFSKPACRAKLLAEDEDSRKACEESSVSKTDEQSTSEATTVTSRAEEKSASNSDGLNGDDEQVESRGRSDLANILLAENRDKSFESCGDMGRIEVADSDGTSTGKNQQRSADIIPTSLSVADAFPSETSVVPESLYNSDAISSETVIPNEAKFTNPADDNDAWGESGFVKAEKLALSRDPARRKSSLTGVMNADDARRISDRLRIKRAIRRDNCRSGQGLSRRGSPTRNVRHGRTKKHVKRRKLCTEAEKRIIEWIHASAASKPLPISRDGGRKKFGDASSNALPKYWHRLHGNARISQGPPESPQSPADLVVVRRKRKCSRTREENYGQTNAWLEKRSTEIANETMKGQSVRRELSELQPKVRKISTDSAKSCQKGRDRSEPSTTSSDQVVELVTARAAIAGKKTEDHLRLRRQPKRREKNQLLRSREGTSFDGRNTRDPDLQLRIDDDEITESRTKSVVSREKYGFVNTALTSESSPRAESPSDDNERFKIPTVAPVRSSRKSASERSPDLPHGREVGETCRWQVREKSWPQKYASQVGSSSSYALPKFPAKILPPTPMIVKSPLYCREPIISPIPSPYFSTSTFVAQSPYFSKGSTATCLDRADRAQNCLDESGSKGNAITVTTPSFPVPVGETPEMGLRLPETFAEMTGRFPSEPVPLYPGGIVTATCGKHSSETRDLSFAESQFAVPKQMAPATYGPWTPSISQNPSRTCQLSLLSQVPETPELNPFGIDCDQTDFEIQFKTPILSNDYLCEEEQRQDLFCFERVESTQPFTPQTGINPDLDFSVWTPRVEDICRSEHCTEGKNGPSIAPESLSAASEKAAVFGLGSSVSDESKADARRSPKYESVRKRWLTRWTYAGADSVLDSNNHMAATSGQIEEINRSETRHTGILVLDKTISTIASREAPYTQALGLLNEATRPSGSKYPFTDVTVGTGYHDSVTNFDTEADRTTSRNFDSASCPGLYSSNDENLQSNLGMEKEVNNSSSFSQHSSLAESTIPWEKDDEGNIDVVLKVVQENEMNLAKNGQFTSKPVDGIDRIMPEISFRRASPTIGEIFVSEQKWLIITDSLGRHVYIDPVTGNSRLEKPVSPERGALDSAAANGELCFTSHPILSYGASLFQPRSKEERHPQLCDESEVQRIRSSNMNLMEKDRDIKWRYVTKEGLAEIQNQLAQWQNPVFERAKNILTLLPESSDIRYHQRETKMHTFVKQDFHNLEVLNQVDEKFIACVLNSVANGKRLRYLVLIDQHAAHERVRLEMFTENLTLPNGHMRTSEIPPIKINLPKTELELLRSIQRKIARLGVQLEIRSDHLLVIGVPRCFTYSDRQIEADKNRISALISEIIETYRSCRGALVKVPQTVQELLWSQACHGAIKFGDKLNLRECRNLITSLGTCHLPFQCAHGRPSLVPLLDILDLHEKSIRTRNKPDLRRLNERMMGKSEC